MTTRIPLAEASSDEIQARVAYQIILADYRLNPDAYDNVSDRILILAAEWYGLGATILAADLRLAGLWCATGAPLAGWLQSRLVYSPARASKQMRAPRR